MSENLSPRKIAAFFEMSDPLEDDEDDYDIDSGSDIDNIDDNITTDSDEDNDEFEDYENTLLKNIEKVEPNSIERVEHHNIDIDSIPVVFVNDEVVENEGREEEVSDEYNEDDNNNVDYVSNQNWCRVYPPEDEFDVAEKFRVRNPGVRDCPPRNSAPIEYFMLFFTNTIWKLLTEETNKYAKKIIEKKRTSGNMKKFSRAKQWANITISTMKKFICLLMNMGLTRRKNVVDYWDTASSQYVPFYHKIMSVNQFQLICSMFHISSKKRGERGQPGYDPWFKVRFFIDYLNQKFLQHFIPAQNLALDESMIGMKNRCTFIQYMPQKRHARFGIKKFELCDSQSSYVLQISMYSGKDFLLGEEGPFTQKVVMDLMTRANVLDKGYHLFIDNYYTKLPLTRHLYSRKTFVTGTINKNSREISKSVVNYKLGVQESIYYRSGPVLLVGYKQKKTRKPVYLLTTGCHAEDKLIKSKSGAQAVKPELIHKYNLSMGGVDSSDKSIYHVSCTRPTKKYWKKIFMNFLDMALLNSFLLYERNTEKPMERKKFIVHVIEELSRAAEDRDEPTVPESQQGDHSSHVLTHLPGRQERLCGVCGPFKKRGRSHYWCPGCNCGVHPACFHQLKHIWRPMRCGRKRKASDSE